VPDIFYNWAAPADVSKFVESGVALDIREYLDLSPSLSLDDWAESQLKAVTYDGVPYMMPTVGATCFMLYNTALFEQQGLTPPKDWDELLAVSKKFTEAGIVPINTGSKGGNPGHFFYNAVLSAMPNGQADAEAALTTYNVSTPPFREAAKVISEMVKAKVFPSDTIANGDWTPSIALYNQGKAAMLYTCPWMLGLIEPEIAAVTDVTYFPTVPGAALEGNSFHIGNINNGWMINRASFQDPAKQPAIVSLMDALQGAEVKRLTLEQGYFPGWKAGDLSGVKLDPLPAEVQTFTGEVPDTYPGLYTFMPTAGSLTAYLEAMDKLFAGEDPDAVIDAFQSTLDREKP
jgi:ABC-type glycerol-3-phosphate transport system substrate-binding protein